MQLSITVHNLELNPEAEAYIQRKFAPVQRRLRDIAEAKLELRRESTRSAPAQVVAQVTLNVNGTLLRAEEREPTVNAAIDRVTQAIARQAMRYKERHFASLRAKKSGNGKSIRSAAIADATPPTETEAATISSGKVVRVKRFPMKPLAIEEAAAQMELLGHDFFFFINAATGQYNVLYRRKDGDYTVIEPEAL
ncbi:MAG: ribosome-associated translation inhibitor RaiA [Chloroflexi bacterium]|nr:ribosome-associated translation inhibitor RaiA [Chloroflexota bacterium]